MLDGFQLSKKPAGQCVNKLLSRHANANPLPLFKFNKGKLEIFVSFHVATKVTPLLKSMLLGKLVSPLDCHALVKFTFCALVPSFASAGNDVRDGQDCHADEKLFPVLKSMLLGKLVSPLCCHALLNLTLLASVPSFASCGNCVRDEQPCHADEKLVPLEALIAGKDVREEQFRHASMKFVPLEVSSNGNDVRDEQLSHAWMKVVTLEVSTKPNSTISPRANQKVFKD